MDKSKSRHLNVKKKITSNDFGVTERSRQSLVVQLRMNGTCQLIDMKTTFQVVRPREENGQIVVQGWRERFQCNLSTLCGQVPGFPR